MRKHRTRFGFILALALLGPASSVYAADLPSFEDRLVVLEKRQTRHEDDLEAIGARARQRSGLIGIEEVEKRFEDAVFESLMGEYESAALEFSILLDARALGSPDLIKDTEWYLGECLFELGNYITAEDRYKAIVAQGPAHPFFADSIRRLLEIYGLTNKRDKFDQLYIQYISTNKVAPTDIINYTLAKSFYRQGEIVKAKALFSEFAPESPYYGRALYFLGTILVTQNDLENAALEFAKASQVPVTTLETRDVVDLANLAFGRLQYELGRYRESSEAYLKIGRDSKYFADSLYELVWTFIKQGEREEAIRAIEIFLLAFPEHQYAAQLKVYKGHLHMQEERYESANSTYEKVVAEYSPIRDLVSAVEVSQDQPRLFFERLAKDDALDVLNRIGLPPFAAEMLFARSNIAETVEVRHNLEVEAAQIESSARTIDELETALLSGSHSLGSFRNARESVLWIRKDKLSIYDGLINLEADYLIEFGSGSVRGKVEKLNQQRELAGEAANKVRASDTTPDDRASVYAEQVRAVQTQAFLVEQMAQDLLRELSATSDYIDLGKHDLSLSQASDLREQLKEAKVELDLAIQGLRPLQGEATLTRLMGAVPKEDVEALSEDEVQVLDDYSSLHAELARYRGQITQAGAREFFSRVDALWTRTGRVDTKAVEVRNVLDEVESEEVIRIRQALAREATIVSTMSREGANAMEEADLLGTAATRDGFHDLALFFNDAVMQADMGIVDVYWARKVAVSDRIDDLKVEKNKLITELKEQFDDIGKKLEN